MASSRLDKLRSRRIDPLVKVAGLNEAYNRLATEDSSVQYAIGAMQPIDPDYTRRTIEERTRIEKQLTDGYVKAGLHVDFAYQGSVTNDTHIRVYSDVDLLTVEERWFGIEPPNIPIVPYVGDPIQNLRQIRTNTVKILRPAFPAATVDESGSKSISVSGGSLRRKIDVISCAWWHTVEYVQDTQRHWLGIEILDNDKGQRISNKPFLHNKRIEERDAATNGGLRKAIRLLKSLRYDSDDKIDLSSYDIAGIAYNIFDEWLAVSPGQDLLLVRSCREYLRYLIDNKPYRDLIAVPNKMRKVFCAEGANEVGLRQMSVAVDTLVAEIEQGLSRSFRKLAEARVRY
jgi:hypothetical protein